MDNLKNTKLGVKPLRAAGLEAKWTKSQTGRPILVARDPQAGAKHQREVWHVVDWHMWQAMQARGIREAFDSYTLLSNFFSIKV